MSLTVTYKGADLIDETADCVKVMKTQGKYLEDDITIDYTGGTAPTLISKSITANGTYNASSDNADGYSSVTVNVPPSGYTDNDVLNKTYTELRSNDAISINSYGLFDCRSLKKCIIPNATFLSGSTQVFCNCSSLEYCDISNYSGELYGNFTNFSSSACKVFKCQNVTGLRGNALRQVLTGCKYMWFKAVTQFGNQSLQLFSGNLIISTSTVPILADVNAFGNAHIYVKDSLVNTYKAETNWTSKASYIFGYSDISVYDNTTTYNIGDLCRYNDKVYVHCNESLTTTTGNPPSGTSSNNDYWDYIDDVEVT